MHYFFFRIGFTVYIKPDVHLDETIPICARDQHLLYNIFGAEWKSPVVISAYTAVKGQTGFMLNWTTNGRNHTKSPEWAQHLFRSCHSDIRPTKRITFQLIPLEYSFYHTKQTTAGCFSVLSMIILEKSHKSVKNHRVFYTRFKYKLRFCFETEPFFSPAFRCINMTSLFLSSYQITRPTQLKLIW